MKTLFNDGHTAPIAFVTKGRQRVKQYNNDTVYLNNGDEFEIELYNPTTNKVLAKIELNGLSLGSGIVLRPGERVFLERHLNESKKFLFETYEVDGNNPNVQKAIANNGKVSVMFYYEKMFYDYGSSWAYTTSWPHSNPTITYGGYSNPTFSSGGTVHGQGTSEVNCFYASLGSLNPPSKSIETGRVEKGSQSNQSFTYDNTSFNTWWSWKSEWIILPTSRKPIEARDLKVFCTNCGAKQKKHTFKFCPNCGTKY